MQPPPTQQYLTEDPYGLPEYDGRAGWEALEWNAAPPGEYVPHQADALLGGASLTSQTLKVVPDVVVPPDPAGMAMGAYGGATISANTGAAVNQVGMNYKYVAVTGTYEEANCFQALYGVDPTWLWGYLDGLRTDRQESTQGVVLGWSTSLTDPNSLYRQQAQPMIEWLDDPDLPMLQWELDVPSAPSTYTLDGTQSALNPVPAPYNAGIQEVDGARVIADPGWSGSVEAMGQLQHTVDLLAYHGPASWQDALDTRIGARGGFAWVVASHEQMVKFIPSPPETVSSTSVAVAAYSMRLRFRTPAYRLWTRLGAPPVVAQLPLRQRQRDDGLGLSSARWRRGRSVQASNRWRGYR